MNPRIAHVKGESYWRGGNYQGKPCRLFLISLMPFRSGLSPQRYYQQMHSMKAGPRLAIPGRVEIEAQTGKALTRMKLLKKYVFLCNDEPSILGEDQHSRCYIPAAMKRLPAIILAHRIYMLEKSAAPNKKISRMNLNTAEEATPGETIRSKKPSRWNVDHAQINTEMVAGEVNGNNGAKPNEVKRKGVKNVSTNSRPTDKLKVLDSAFVLPSTSMAAHAAVDEVVETIEEEKVKVLCMNSMACHFQFLLHFLRSLRMHIHSTRAMMRM